jgi:hypothetical protein
VAKILGGHDDFWEQGWEATLISTPGGGSHDPLVESVHNPRLPLEPDCRFVKVPWSGWGVPQDTREGLPRAGTEVKADAAALPSPPVSTTQRLSSENATRRGQGKAVGIMTGGFAV